MTIEWYDREGKPLPDGVEGAERLLRDKDYKIIAQTELANGWWVSTVWLGLNHPYGEDALPLIFETMVFTSRDGSGRDTVWMQRYATEAEARAGHAQACDLDWHTLRVLAEGV